MDGKPNNRFVARLCCIGVVEIAQCEGKNMCALGFVKKCIKWYIYQSLFKAASLDAARVHAAMPVTPQTVTLETFLLVS